MMLAALALQSIVISLIVTTRWLRATTHFLSLIKENNKNYLTNAFACDIILLVNDLPIKDRSDLNESY
jgi:hypothetical protein